MMAMTTALTSTVISGRLRIEEDRARSSWENTSPLKAWIKAADRMTVTK